MSACSVSLSQRQPSIHDHAVWFNSPPATTRQNFQGIPECIDKRKKRETPVQSVNERERESWTRNAIVSYLTRTVSSPYRPQPSCHSNQACSTTLTQAQFGRHCVVSLRDSCASHTLGHMNRRTKNRQFLPDRDHTYVHGVTTYDAIFFHFNSARAILPSCACSVS